METKERDLDSHPNKLRMPTRLIVVKKCPQFKSLHICAHTVATAETNGALVKFVGVFLKHDGQKPANFTKLALHDMPSHPGKKRNERIRKWTPKKSLPTDDPFSGDFKL